MDKKSVTSRIYTYPTAYGKTHFLAYFFGFSFLSKLDHYCPISRIQNFTMGELQFFTKLDHYCPISWFFLVKKMTFFGKEFGKDFSKDFGKDFGKDFNKDFGKDLVRILV